MRRSPKHLAPKRPSHFSIRAAVIGTVLVASIIGGVSYAAIPDSSGVIHGCFMNRRPHTLSVINTAKHPSCPWGTTAISWSQTGPAGPTGAPGAPGVSGNTILNGTSVPSSAVGNNGDFYIDTATMALYGPESGGVWPSGVSLSGATNYQLLQPDAYLVNCNLSGVNMTNLNVSGANLAGAIMEYANLTNTNFAGSNFADASDYTFVHANLTNTDMAGANLPAARLGSADIMTGVNFTNANMPEANLLPGNLTSDTFTGANLLSASGLAYGNLTGVSLANANLTYVSLGGSNLTDANLTGANLTNASLGGANVTGASLTGVVWDDTTCPDGTNSNNDLGTCVNNL